MFKDAPRNTTPDHDAATIEALSVVEGPDVRLDTGTHESSHPHPTIRHGGFDQPQWMWGLMFACYGIFFLSIILATGRDTEAIFVIIISILYALFYFSVAGVLGALQNTGKASPLECGTGEMETWTGTMSRSAVAAQILGVPAALAFFGIMFAIIRLIVAP